MRDEAGLGGGAMEAGFGGGAMSDGGCGDGDGAGRAAEARWAEFMAGNEGGGKLSSASSSELSSAASVRLGMAGAFGGLPRGAALGVVCGEGLSRVSCCVWSSGTWADAASSLPVCEDLASGLGVDSGGPAAAGKKELHVEGGWW